MAYSLVTVVSLVGKYNGPLTPHEVNENNKKIKRYLLITFINITFVNLNQLFI